MSANKVGAVGFTASRVLGWHGTGRRGLSGPASGPPPGGPKVRKQAEPGCSRPVNVQEDYAVWPR